MQIRRNLLYKGMHAASHGKHSICVFWWWHRESVIIAEAERLLERSKVSLISCWDMDIQRNRDRGTVGRKKMSAVCHGMSPWQPKPVTKV